MKRYKVHINTSKRKYVYFDTLENARAFCNEVFNLLHIVLSIVEVKQ